MEDRAFWHGALVFVCLSVCLCVEGVFDGFFYTEFSYSLHVHVCMSHSLVWNLSRDTSIVIDADFAMSDTCGEMG